MADLRARASGLERQISLLHLRDAAGAQPDPLAAPLTASELQARLGLIDGLLAYHILDDEILAFVLVGGELTVTRMVSRVSSIEPLVARLASQLDRFSAGPEFVARHLDVLDRSARLALADLYAELVAPLADRLDAISGSPRRLVVVPHGLLHQIPFHALCGDGRTMIEDFEITYAPSTTALTIEQPATLSHGGALVVGVADPLIPMVSQEIAAVARHLDGVAVLANEQATLRAVREQAPGRAVLHMACHGLFRSDNPIFSALRLGDGWLTAADIARLDLRGALVALSACESGRGRVYDGDEVVGLTRAFLAAGARTLLVSHWLVHDEAAAILMELWYAQMRAGQSAAAALRTAQMAVRERSPHPYYWAPFFLVGLF
jgi:CHAT domain-containing protein